MHNTAMESRLFEREEATLVSNINRYKGGGGFKAATIHSTHLSVLIIPKDIK